MSLSVIETERGEAAVVAFGGYNGACNREVQAYRFGSELDRGGDGTEPAPKTKTALLGGNPATRSPPSAPRRGLFSFVSPPQREPPSIGNGNGSSVGAGVDARAGVSSKSAADDSRVSRTRSARITFAFGGRTRLCTRRRRGRAPSGTTRRSGALCSRRAGRSWSASSGSGGSGCGSRRMRSGRSRGGWRGEGEEEAGERKSFFW